MSDPETLGVYAAKAQEYADVTGNLAHDPQLHAFNDAVETGIRSSRDALGRLYAHFTQEESTGLLADAGLIVKDHAKGCDKGLDGTDADWLCLRAWQN